MIRTPLILVASFGLLVGCATSSANTPPNNPDAGKVNYDVGKPSSGSGGGGTDNTGTNDGGTATPPKGVDATSTHTPGIGPKVVKKIAAAKPPKAEEPVDPKKPPPKRKGRVDPNGLLGESFTIDAKTDRLPDFAAIGAAKSLFIVPNLEQATRLPATLKGPVALRYTGSLNITAAAEYKLCTTSSDGSKLMIEGTVVVANDAIHKEAAEMCEVVNLEPGEYAVEIQSFHVSGPIVLAVTWATSKDGTPAPIPKGNFYKPEGADDKVKAGAK
jgi:hypothetical protein